MTMYNYNIYLYYNENSKYLKEYEINEEHEIFQEIWQVQFPYLFKAGDTIRIDNFLNQYVGKYYIGEVIAKVETVEFDLYLETDLAGIDVNIGLEII